MPLISDFVDRYRREFDFFDQAARLVGQQLDSQLQTSGIRTIVTSRAKRPESLKRKLEQRSGDTEYEREEDIYADIIDLAGVRVALYFPGDRGEVDKIIRNQFILKSPAKQFPGSSTPNYSKRFSGYWATHYRVQLNDSNLNEYSRRYSSACVEIQVASVLMHAWAEVEHDLVYKPSHGILSENEYAILDELNGLVLSGEIALERLQRAVEDRVTKQDTPFSNHYELAVYVSEAAKSVLKSPIAETALGRVNILFDFLQRTSLNTPKAITPFVASLHSDIDRKPISEQVIDQILAGDSSKYDDHAKSRAEQERYAVDALGNDRGVSTEKQKAIGYFLSQWIPFERLIRELARNKDLDISRYSIPYRDTLERLELLDDKGRYEIELMRQLRNTIVHGIESPDVNTIFDAGERMHRLFGMISSKPEFHDAAERALS